MVRAKTVRGASVQRAAPRGKAVRLQEKDHSVTTRVMVSAEDLARDPRVGHGVKELEGRVVQKAKGHFVTARMTADAEDLAHGLLAGRRRRGMFEAVILQIRAGKKDLVRDTMKRDLVVSKKQKLGRAALKNATASKRKQIFAKPVRSETRSGTMIASLLSNPGLQS